MDEISIRSKYERLYHKLKAQIVEVVERESRAQIRPDVVEDLFRIVSLLPHPKVASIQDIREVCKECVMGKLEYFYRYFGEEARVILQGIEDEYPDELLGRTIGSPPRVISEAIEPTQLANYFNWSSSALYEVLSLTRSIRSITDIIMKGQCPFCQRDLVTVVVSNELRLRCKSKTTPQCKTVDWCIGNVSQKPQP